jgi:hypothetical protein
MAVAARHGIVTGMATPRGVPFAALHAARDRAQSAPRETEPHVRRSTHGRCVSHAGVDATVPRRIAASPRS